MIDFIIYVNRKAQPNYHSIEGIFDSVARALSERCKVLKKYTALSGASPRVILNNLMSFKKDKRNVYHITGDVHYMALVTGKRTVLTIHDIGSAVKGFMLKKLYIKLFWFWLPALKVARITVISEFTKQELQKIIPFAKHKIVIVPNPVSSDYRPSSYDFNEDNPKILVMGTKANKNLSRIFQAVKNIECELSIVGPLTNSQINELQGLNIKYNNRSNLSRTDIINTYASCDLLCFPSTYEGFGMPIIEAQATGRPVLTSNLGAMFEVAGNSACLVNPFDSQNIKEGLEKIILDSDYRKHLVKLGYENAKRYNLEVVSNKYLEIYEELSEL